jgi:adenine deaminase
VIANERIIDYLHLPFAGILSTESAYDVDTKLKELHCTVKRMGCKLQAPFIQMSFLSLPVIPSLKITDKGLVDVDAFKLIDPIQNQRKNQVL